MNIRERMKYFQRVLLNVLILAVLTTSSMDAAPSMPIINATLRAGFVPDHSVLCVVDGDGSFPIEAYEKLGLRKKGHTRLLHNLNDLDWVCRDYE